MNSSPYNWSYIDFCTLAFLYYLYLLTFLLTYLHFYITYIYTATTWKLSKYGVISRPYFPVFGLNTGKCGPEITPYLDTFHAVSTACIGYFHIVANQYKKTKIKTLDILITPYTGCSTKEAIITTSFVEHQKFRE